MYHPCKINTFCQRVIARQLNETQKLDYYKSLRIYRNHSRIDILNNLVVNKALNYDFIVNNAMVFYKTLNTCLGKTISNKIIENTIGRVFTAGSDISSLERTMNEKGQGMSFILDYCSEALENMDNPDQFFDQNSHVFRDTILTCGKNPTANCMIAIKVSGLCETHLLRKFSQSQINLNSFVKQDISVKDIFNNLRSCGLDLTIEEEGIFLNDILNVMSADSIITPTEWRFKVHAFYLYDFQKNENKVIKHFNQFSEQEYLELRELQQRIDVFMEPAQRLKVAVAVDAEQSYLQPAIDCICEQLEAKHNTNQNFIVFNTFQNYLKNASDRVDYEIDKADKFQRPIALKMVRGAYMVEESGISKESGSEYPICESFEETSRMYDNNVKKLLDLSQKFKSQIMIASHNEETIEQVKDFMKQTDVPKNSRKILFAQLYGLSDHLTYALKEQEYQVYKYMPFGETDIMIPYLIRRAQESRKMLSSNKLQSQLLLDELRNRIFQKNF